MLFPFTAADAVFTVILVASFYVVSGYDAGTLWALPVGYVVCVALAALGVKPLYHIARNK
jgi:hypothetical protein